MDPDETIEVPDLLGMPVHAAEELAAESRLWLTADDPDGPSLRARTWPGSFRVVAQDPVAGTRIAPWDRVVIGFEREGGQRPG